MKQIFELEPKEVSDAVMRWFLEKHPELSEHWANFKITPPTFSSSEWKFTMTLENRNERRDDTKKNKRAK